MCCFSGGSLLGGIGNGHLVQWSSSRGEMRPLGVPIVLGLPEDAVCQEGRAGGELVARWQARYIPPPSLHPPYFVSKYSLPHVSLFCLPASLLHSRSPLSLLCCETALQCTRSPGFGETQISSWAGKNIIAIHFTIKVFYHHLKYSYVMLCTLERRLCVMRFLQTSNAPLIQMSCLIE